MRTIYAVVAVAMAIPLAAFAGKRELDEANLKTIDESHGAAHVASNLAEGIVKYCTDDASKKAMCQLKSLTIAVSKPAGFTFKDGKGVATTDGNASCSFGQYTQVLDK